MSTNDSQDAPEKPVSSAESDVKILLWSIGAVFGCSFLGALIGLGIGAALGSFFPGYYRSLFLGGSDPNFDAFAVGIGQGLTQGLAFGAVVGLLLVAMFYWYRSRRGVGSK